MPIPTRVDDATATAEAAGFTMACDPGTGALLSVLAAAVPSGGRILELGTGTGVGLAWIVEGLGARTDVTVTSVEVDPTIAAFAAGHAWPDYVELIAGDALDVIRSGAQWDLIFADAQGGKWEGFDDTVASLAPRGVLLLDDMTPAHYISPEHPEKIAETRANVFGHPELHSVEIAWSTGLILSTKR